MNRFFLIIVYLDSYFFYFYKKNVYEKILYFNQLFLAVFYSCNQNNVSDKNETQSASTDSNLVLDDLLKINNVTELEKKFGEGNVTIDTLWGPEGTFAIGIKLFPGTANEVEIMWEDTIHYTKMSSALVNNEKSEWRTKEGIYIGMPLEELVQINQKPVKFYGFGWDYGGGVSSFEKGILENAHVGIGLTYTSENLSEDEIMKILGEQELISNQMDFAKYKIVVSQINVYNPH